MLCFAGVRRRPTVRPVCGAHVDRKQYAVMPADVIRRRLLAVLFCACAVNAHFNLYMNETETWRLLGKPVRSFRQT